MFKQQKFYYGAILAALVFGIALLRAVNAFAAPNYRDCSGGNAAILAPQSGATVTGVVQIEGTASLGGDFQYYKLEVAPAGAEAWGDLVGAAREQVVNGQLGVWDSAGVADGAYTIRLRVVDPTGNYCEATVTNINVQNSVPTAVPTPEFTITPTEAPPVQNAVPTPLPTISVQGTTTPGPSPTAVRPSITRTPVPVGTTLGGIEIEPFVSAITDFFSALGRTFLFGAFTMAGIFILVGVIFFVRRVL
ncbi:MAG: hypothetical protein HY741_07370 [Chloroflexi bacterium]|nr:hypothetical protein [Chloroflexota bacterium]